MNRKILLFGFLIGSIITTNLLLGNNNTLLEDPYTYEVVVAQQDTVPDIKERYGDFIHDRNRNPFDLKDPSAIEKSVEFDPVTGKYVLRERIGDTYFRPPTYMSFEEYLEYRNKADQDAYFQQLSALSSNKGGNTLDPLEELDLENIMLERLFGGTEVDIRPQGNIDLTFGLDYQELENPILTERQRRQGPLFDFDMNIQMNVDGKIGEKLNLSTNYNTNATFDFDNQIKLNYNSDLANNAFSEDDIIKNIEAGNVSLPLRGTLIEGAQSLFGLKTELQFGRLYLTSIISQQKSERENIRIEGGSQLQEFEVRSDEYDENRHFFLSFYNRETFEGNLENMPQIRSLFKLENIEVWITNDRNEVDNVRDIVAFADLGEPVTDSTIVAPTIGPGSPQRDVSRRRFLPDNNANDLYGKIVANPNVREIDQAVSILQTGDFQLQQARDFEKVSARRLRPNEYTVHPELGFISLNINVQPDQVVGVAYQYSYNGKNYKVGELSINSEATKPDSSLNVLFVKMLKSTTQRPDVPTWDLMMKNVYSVGAFQVNQKDFRLDVFYDDPGKGLKRFLPNAGRQTGVPLLRLFNLDLLNIQGDPQRDGIFDFVPGVTINLQNGRVMFPVLEPFGSSLARQLEPEFRDQYVYQQLYDSTLFLAREFPELNRFTIKGEYKSAVTSEISLGAFNIPEGSVRVTAGGQVLQEGRDYEIDYNIGRVRILNDAILNSGVPVNVSFEDNTLFGFQTKTMLGVRADYRISDDFNIGGTWLKLFERPFTQKVNIGDDPINNSIYGLDVTMNKEAPFLTKMVDAIPGLSTKAPSSISLNAEFAALKPNHSRAINQNRQDDGGVVYLDDFEGAASTFDLRQPVLNWFLASTPQNDAENNNPLFPESALVNDLRNGANRAKLSWYRIDESIRSQEDRTNPYTSQIPQTEVFPNIQIPPDQLPNIQTLDLSYFPTERGPYNFDVPNGYPGFTDGIEIVGDDIVLRNPETRWAGVMRELNNNDFQSANIEFLEFWMLSPFLDPQNPQSPAPNFQQKEGTLYINLGNISEDILRDSRKFFENGLPAPINPTRRVDTTAWSVVPVAQQITRAFDNDEASREVQDVGLDGLDDAGERRNFREYLSEVSAANPSFVQNNLNNDPAGDNFRYFRDASFTPEANILTRYRDFNNPQGNSRANSGGNTLNSATNIPDNEDLNNDNTLNETEAYFQYEVPLRADPTNPRQIDINRTPFVTDQITSPDGSRIWYRFRIPLRGNNKKSVGGIRDFRSIRFMRMYMSDFEAPVTLRFARLELIRNQWRQYTKDLNTEPNPIPCDALTTLDVDAVNIEENSNRQPFNYTLPVDIQREQSLGVFNTLQNEQSLTMVVNGLCEEEEKAIFRNLDMDFRVYEKIKMFVHAEALDGPELEDGDISIFMRLGSDFVNNYYEYEIPLILSNPDSLEGLPQEESYKFEVWKPENEFDLPLDILREFKVERNNDPNATLTEEYVKELMDQGKRFNDVLRIKGNPNFGLVKSVMIGVRNRAGGQQNAVNAEVWINELRLTGLDNRGGVAAIARMDMQLADFGSVTVAGNYSSIGFGALDEKVQERAREDVFGYDIAGNFELGKFFPDKWALRLPFYGQISNVTRTPEFDPYDMDLVLKNKIENAETAQERDSIKNITQDVTNIKSFNFTNVGKDRTGQGKKPRPWDVENVSLNYSYTETERRDPLIEFDNQKQYRGGVDYNFSRQVKYVEPFKGVKGRTLQLLSQFNFNPLPNSFTFSTILDREFTVTKYRFTGLEDRFSTFYNKRFTWDRNYDLNWDLTKSLKIQYSATNQGVIDELDEDKILDERPDITDEELRQLRRDSIRNGLRNLGRNKNFRHGITASYNLPIQYLPLLDWVQVRANYQASYSWTAAALNADSLGNIIQNTQDIRLNADLNFEALYNKIPYLAKINQGNGNRRGGRPGGNTTRRPAQNNDQGDDKEKKKRDGPSTLERVLIRPLMALRNARFNYSEKRGTILPGFLPQSSIIGMDSDFEAPGLDFVFGYQPQIRTLEESQYYTSEDWLHQAAENGWISRSVFLNQEVIQTYTQEYDGRVTLEPFSEFRLELDFNRRFTEDHSEFFKDTIGGSDLLFHAVPKQIGQLNMTYSALSTLFQDDRDEIINLFQTFENNRAIISNRIGGTELHSDSLLAVQGFKRGYGRTQQDVLIPAFLAAYRGEDPNSVKLNLFDLLPSVNWTLTYNGLSRIPLFAELFRNFSLRHGYKSNLTINRFNTGLDYLRTVNINGAVNELNQNFYPRTEIPEVVISEGFQPLIAVDATLTNGMSFNIDYKKTRTLAMSFISNQLSEQQQTELVIGFGYLVRNLDIPFLTGSKKRRSNRDNSAPAPNPGGGGGGGRGRGQLQGRDLDISFDFRLTDDVTFNHLLDQGIVEPTRGNYSLSISPAAEYQINSRLSLRLFFDYRRVEPKTSAGFPRTDSSGGVVARFSLN